MENEEYSGINLFTVSCVGERVGIQEEELFSPNQRAGK